MGRSEAHKKRRKLIREGRLTPEINRSPYAKLDLRTRKTKNKKDHLYRTKHKNRHPQKWENDSFFIDLFVKNCKSFLSYLSNWY
ncbi:hypothetical protein SAMN05216389_106172 [Oceanobacillus limi]|uniref:Uncharacterized protein n=1 Tax=Oceanobacillus limi TaxID=930131 RepID=A0A1I0CD62_9BACI|nr:hypothetical protein [Oceanobacillus limi]SET17525.1 hypothetical protein SAMN05216389_106172 [Oceanobacillus limi]